MSDSSSLFGEVRVDFSEVELVDFLFVPFASGYGSSDSIGLLVSILDQVFSEVTVATSDSDEETIDLSLARYFLGSEHVEALSKLADGEGAASLVNNLSEELIDDISLGSLVKLLSLYGHLHVLGFVSSSVLGLHTSHLFEASDLLLLSGELLLVFLDLLVLLVDVVSELEEVVVLLLNFCLELFVLPLDLVKLGLLLSNELLLVLNFHNRCVNLSLEHHLFVLVLAGLLVNGDEDLGLADDVIVADDLFVHLHSHSDEFVLGVVDYGLEFFFVHSSDGEGLKFLLELGDFLEDGGVVGLDSLTSGVLNLFVDPSVIVQFASLEELIVSLFVVLEPVLLHGGGLLLESVSGGLDGVDVLLKVLSAAK